MRSCQNYIPAMQWTQTLKRDLLDLIWFNIQSKFCRPGHQGQPNLKKDDFLFENDDTGREYVTSCYKDAQKNHQGLQRDHREEKPVIYGLGGPDCPMAVLKLYLSKLNPKSALHSTNSHAERNGPSQLMLFATITAPLGWILFGTWWKKCQRQPNWVQSIPTYTGRNQVCGQRLARLENFPSFPLHFPLPLFSLSSSFSTFLPLLLLSPFLPNFLPSFPRVGESPTPIEVLKS